MGDPSPRDARVQRPGGKKPGIHYKESAVVGVLSSCLLWEAESRKGRHTPTGAAWLWFSSAPIRPFPKHNSVPQNKSVVGVKMEAIWLHGSHIDEISSSSLASSKLRLREERE